ncbi:RNA polymerase sigma factor [Flexithrix dorotheae]|uniref:RNA polymerase sigma factor n=1 Tax=Flexithrix dorotheae TaxID=70993 RepID=UPI00037AE1A6|nr:sigma-70 family RNA polymerase sigma factor [Flexithrix dorotheae]
MKTDSGSRDENELKFSNLNTFHSKTKFKSKDKLSDKEIWISFQHGDETAFNYIYETYFQILFNYGHQFTTDRGLVKDLIQDLFIELREKKNRLHISSFKFYLLKCLKRKLMEVLSSKKWKQNISFNEKDHGFEIVLSHESILINSQIKKDVKDKLEIAFQSLSKTQKEILFYYYYDGLSYQEITELMGFSKIEHTRVVVFRAISKLKLAMNRYKIKLFEIMILLGFFFYTLFKSNT